MYVRDAIPFQGGHVPIDDYVYASGQSEYRTIQLLTNTHYEVILEDDFL